MTTTDRATIDRLRDELRAARNDLLNVRGLLSPNGGQDVTPVPLVPTVAPAVAWLVDELANVRAELAAMTDRALACATLAGSLRDELEGSQAAGHDQAVAQLRRLGAVVVEHQRGDIGPCLCGWAERSARYSDHLLDALADALTATREGSDG